MLARQEARMTLIRVNTDPPAETGAPAPERLIAGNPRFTTWESVARQGLYAGIWESTPGKWRVVYDEWEYCHILAGVSILTDADGAQTRLAAGDSIVIEPGFSGTWEVIETTRKDYVIVLEPPQ